MTPEKIKKNVWYQYDPSNLELRDYLKNKPSDIIIDFMIKIWLPRLDKFSILRLPECFYSESQKDFMPLSYKNTISHYGFPIAFMLVTTGTNDNFDTFVKEEINELP